MSTENNFFTVLKTFGDMVIASLQTACTAWLAMPNAPGASVVQQIQSDLPTVKAAIDSATPASGWEPVVEDLLGIVSLLTPLLSQVPGISPTVVFLVKMAIQGINTLISSIPVQPPAAPQA